MSLIYYIFRKDRIQEPHISATLIMLALTDLTIGLIYY